VRSSASRGKSPRKQRAKRESAPERGTPDDVQARRDPLPGGWRTWLPTASGPLVSRRITQSPASPSRRRNKDNSGNSNWDCRKAAADRSLLGQRVVRCIGFCPSLPKYAGGVPAGRALICDQSRIVLKRRDPDYLIHCRLTSGARHTIFSLRQVGHDRPRFLDGLDERQRSQSELVAAVRPRR
jgi:hypothetical protein